MTGSSILRAALVAALLALPLTGAPVLAVQPDEMLDDPVLEARARALSEGLRCVVCRNESIDESNAEIAADMRVLLRERIVAGDTDAQVMAFFVERYGEYVLLNPRATGANLLLWIAAPAMLLVGGGIAVVYLRRRRDGPASADAPLTSDEEARLRALLND
jgi:cytochrome c-type biogenesis protein CcmH